MTKAPWEAPREFSTLNGSTTFNSNKAEYEERKRKTIEEAKRQKSLGNRWNGFEWVAKKGKRPTM